MRPTKVFLVCPGLGHVVRGYETFTRECFDALAPDERLDLYLYKGAGEEVDGERAVWCPRRSWLATQVLGTLIRRDGYYVEQAAFTAALVAEVVHRKPDVIYFSDGAVGNLLWRWRRLTHGRYKLLLSNGGPLGPPDFPRFDHVHQVLEVYRDESLQNGRPAETQTLIPYGFRIARQFRPLCRDERAALRRTLGLPANRPVVLSVGAINHSHKRMDYVVREIASLPIPRPYLLLLGNQERESAAIIRMGHESLGPDGFRVATVSQAQVPAYYQAADALVLASLKEGFGRVYVEALSNGLPCLAHDYAVARSVLDKHGIFGDFTAPGGLARLAGGLRFGTETDDDRKARHRSAYDRFSWDQLSGRYVDMLRLCAEAPARRNGPGGPSARTPAPSVDGSKR